MHGGTFHLPPHGHPSELLRVPAAPQGQTVPFLQLKHLHKLVKTSAPPQHRGYITTFLPFINSPARLFLFNLPALLIGPALYLKRDANGHAPNFSDQSAVVRL